ncbi:heparan-alpha-glucosaminide N-acetyltransferase-like isoform X1 [Pogonomyrmex barbatus]|uniref:Heparan-alpha-glucosaminide N-acetyltransferase-like isoform X1 n=1 Tax=Pogonomyrmex barbatus TaxID=144034 RepID=A0A6I9WVW6_9HYME|nr:heparan-alpha-glucosaminide N-acetyltransferase-like isoform X1 [Pogonomyrmex barbatus]
MYTSMKKHTSNHCSDPKVMFEIDQACFSILNKYNRSVTLYSRLSDCYLCEGEPQILPAGKNTTLVVPTKYSMHLFYKDTYEYCHTTYSFKEHGSYGWNISEDQLCSEIYTIQEPVNSYLPIYEAIMVYILLLMLFISPKIIMRIIKRERSPDNVRDDLEELQEAETPNLIVRRSSTRIRSVDTFRGITILLMIFVNNGGGDYVFFKHSAWFGLTVADLVLPWFAWVMGLSFTISKRSELRVSNSRGKIIWKCLIRAIILVFLGLMINSIYTKSSIENFRIPGILQLLAVSYFICATIETIFVRIHSQDDVLQFGRFTILRDILNNWMQWLIILAITATHTLITFLLPVPDCPTGYLGPGGYHQFGKFVNCTGGAAGYIDRLVFGSHMYSRTQNVVYGTILRHDPEGIMNTMSIILVVYLGIHAGKILLLYYQCNARIIRWLLWSCIMGIIAGLLCNFDKYSGVIPVSKKMMSLSFVLTTSCFAFILYAILHFLIDYKQYWNGAPFIYAGMNPIALYIGHVLTMGLFPWAWPTLHTSHLTILSMNLWTTTVWSFTAYWLYLKDIIISI